MSNEYLKRAVVQLEGSSESFLNLGLAGCGFCDLESHTEVRPYFKGNGIVDGYCNTKDETMLVELIGTTELGIQQTMTRLDSGSLLPREEPIEPVSPVDTKTFYKNAGSGLFAVEFPKLLSYFIR